MPLTIEAVSTGAQHSTGDVYLGIMAALEAQGHTIFHYPLHRGITMANYCLKAMKRGKFIETIDMAGLQFIAGVFALERALYHNVEWVFIVAGQFFHPDFFVELKLAGRKIALLLTESPYEFAHEWERCKFADVVFTNERRTAATLQQVHPSAHYLPHAYDPARHRPEPPADEPEVRAHDVVFVGTGWPERIALFEAVDWTGIDLGLYGIHWDKRLSRRSPLRQYLSSGTVPNATTAALYRQAKIGLNLHRTSKGHGLVGPHLADGEAESLNPRAYELAACGVFHLSDYRAEGEELFGRAVPTFTDARELGYLIRDSLANDRLRDDCARQLPYLVRGHTFAARAEVITRALEAARAPAVAPLPPAWGAEYRHQEPGKEETTPKGGYE